jgi:hypothetical protein
MGGWVDGSVRGRARVGAGMGVPVAVGGARGGVGMGLSEYERIRGLLVKLSSAFPSLLR